MKSPIKNALAQTIHQEALAVAGRYKKSEVELIDILQKLDRHKVFYTLGYNSLFKYACEALKLSDEVAYVYIKVARTARQVPALKEEIKNGTITVTKAKKISAVINKENQAHWLELAKTASKAKLEKEVALHSPNGGVQDKMCYVNSQMEIVEHAKVKADVARVQLQVGISEKLMLDLRRAQDVLSQKLRRPATLEEMLEAVSSQYLQREDPVKIAERQKMKGKLQASVQLVPGPAVLKQKTAPSDKRTPISAKLKHEVALNFNGRCAQENELGQRCTERRFLEIHHIVPVELGGRNELSNLKLLCAGHHKSQHF